MSAKRFIHRRVVAATRAGKLFGLTVSEPQQANAVLTNGVFLFGRIKQTKQGYTVKHSGKSRRVPATAELR